MVYDDNIAYKSKAFAVRIVSLYKYLCDKKEYVISKQVLRSGTSIGANIAESRFAQSKADFVSKQSIALKETAETKYWLELLNDTKYITDTQFESINNDCVELLKILTAIVNNSNQNMDS